MTMNLGSTLSKNQNIDFYAPVTSGNIDVLTQRRKGRLCPVTSILSRRCSFSLCKRNL
jgi:hypothetical protein